MERKFALNSEWVPTTVVNLNFEHLSFSLAAWLVLAITYYAWKHSCFGVFLSSTCLQHYDPIQRFTWETIETLPHLEYSSCYQDQGNFQCARLELPMDHWNGTTNNTIGLAVIRHPAAVPITDPRYGGPIVINPGGPGGSGIDMVLEAGDAIRTMLDSEHGLMFDIIGFDPRGVGESLPQLQCLDSCRERDWAIRRRQEGILGSSNASLAGLWSISTAYARSCSILREDEGSDIRQHMTTTSVAQDMVLLIEAHGKWREETAARLSGETIAKRLKYIKGEEKLQYWGFSYGTYLGLTFAAMFPNKIHRLTVDGVINGFDYRRDLGFDSVRDAEEDLRLFYTHCARVGHPKCALANDTGKTTEASVKARVDSIIEGLLDNPYPIIEATHPEVISYSDIRHVVLGALYSPLLAFPLLARLLFEIENNSAHSWSSYNVRYKQIEHSSHGRSNSPISTIAIACTDADDQAWLDRHLFREHLDKLTRLSPSIGPMWAEMRMYCANYNIRPYHRFTAPWVANTSHPILLIGNTADPVTPLRAAKEMARGFKDAVVLTQDSPGHCSIAAPSECTASHIKRYFQTGDLPPEKTICVADAVPFGPTLSMRSGNNTTMGSEHWVVMQRAMYMSWKAHSISWHSRLFI